MKDTMITKLTDGRTDLVFELPDRDKETPYTDEHGTPLINWCAYYGDVSAIKYLISKGATLEELGPNYDLNGAAFHGHWQLCQYLLEQGAKADQALPDTGETPLHNCIQPNRPATNFIIELLLSYGADPNVHTQSRVETGAFMREAFTKEETPLHRAAAFGNEEAIQLLLAAGADKTAEDLNGDSPLAWASWHQRPGKILSILTYDHHDLHPLHIKNMQSDHGSGWGAGMSIMRMGKVHLEK